MPLMLVISDDLREQRVGRLLSAHRTDRVATLDVARRWNFLDAVRAGGQIRERVVAVLVGRGGGNDLIAGVEQLERHAGQRRRIGIVGADHAYR